MSMTPPERKPDSLTVDDFHSNSDVDLRPEAQHHTLGGGANQASPGDHDHRGGNSRKLLDGVAIKGARGTDAWRLSIISALVELGATDSSTA